MISLIFTYGFNRLLQFLRPSKIRFLQGKTGKLCFRGVSIMEGEVDKVNSALQNQYYNDTSVIRFFNVKHFTRINKHSPLDQRYFAHYVYSVTLIIIIVLFISAK